MMQGPKEAPPEIDMDQVEEQELSRLLRQYRIMEGDRFAYSGETSGKLKRFKKLIGILQIEQNNLLADLKVATADAKLKNDRKVNQYLDQLLQEYDETETSVKKEKANLIELNYQIKKMGKEVDYLTTQTITDAQAQARIIKGQRTVAMLENKLEVYVKKFNIVVTDNFKLRQEIDHLLKERSHFNLLWEKLIHSLNEGKKFMLDLIEQATLAYDQREEWCNKLSALKARGRQDLMLNTKEMRYLQRKLDQDAKLQEFLGKKGQKRILADLDARENKKKQLLREKMEKQLAQYRGTLKQIQDFCGESDTERLAAKFVKQEEENFALFNYVNELNHESESLSYAIEDLKQNIDEQRELNNQREKQQKDTIDSLEKKLIEETKQAANADKKLEKFDEDLGKVLEGIGNIFELLKCDNAPILELLGENTTVNTYNVKMYIGLIEKQTTDLMQIVYYKEKSQAINKKTKAPPPVLKPDPKSRYKHIPCEVLVPTQPCPLCVEQEQVSDIIDVRQFAQALPEVVENLKKRLELPHALDRLHNVSACHLPQSRKIIQQRYQ